MIKKSAALFCFVCLIVSAVLAHPPSKIETSYDGIDQILTITIYHAVSNPMDHYIKNVTVKKNGEDLLTQIFTEQFDNQKQLVKVLIPKLTNDSQLKIRAQCNKFADKEETFKLVIPGYTDVTPAQAQVLIEEIADLAIIDVSPHYDNGHLPGAKHYYLPNLPQRLNELDKNKTYLVYCHADVPSQSGAKILADNGFSKVYRLKGNYGAWVNAGYPIEK
jgi:rhodanese-related sulfurtransferase